MNIKNKKKLKIVTIIVLSISSLLALTYFSVMPERAPTNFNIIRFWIFPDKQIVKKEILNLMLNQFDSCVENTSCVFFNQSKIKDNGKKIQYSLYSRIFLPNKCFVYEFIGQKHHICNSETYYVGNPHASPYMCNGKLSVDLDAKSLELDRGNGGSYYDTLYMVIDENKHSTYEYSFTNLIKG